MNKIIVLGNLMDEDNKTHSNGRVYSGGGICPTLGATHFGVEKYIMEKVKIRQNTKKGYTELEAGGVANLSYPDSKTRRGRVIEGGRIAPTLETSESVQRIEMDGSNTKYRIRKLTPRECWRLMDFDDKDFDAAAEVNTNTQLYKQAGNSIVVAVLEAILKEML